MNIMAIGAHPDDIEFGCGGTLINHKEFGDKVIYVCMTDTESVDATKGKVIRSESELKSETQCAADVLGVDNIFYLPFKDLHVPFSFDSVSRLETLIKQYQITAQERFERADGRKIPAEFAYNKTQRF